MKYSKLGSSNVDVSRVCLGSMTWGTQNSQQDANEQIDYALAQGVNFIDTAEMYSIPPTAESYGKTEGIIGNWLAQNTDKRKDIFLASKIAGNGIPHVRNAENIKPEDIEKSLDASLKRLQTDYLDLYQLHWPNRPNPHFVKHWPNHIVFSRCDAERERGDMLGILQALNDCIKAGKIRFCGLSDDTPWGIQTFMTLSEKYSLPKMVSIQNEFNLLHSKDWPYLLETCIMEDVAFLPWSPLAGGVLSGKYANGVIPKGSRWSMSQRNGLFRNTERVHSAVAAYQTVAAKYGLTATELALRWCDSIDGVTSTIIGATSMAQLTENLGAFKAAEQPLSDELNKEILAVLKQYAIPF